MAEYVFQGRGLSIDMEPYVFDMRSGKQKNKMQRATQTLSLSAHTPREAGHGHRSTRLRPGTRLILVEKNSCTHK